MIVSATFSIFKGPKKNDPIWKKVKVLELHMEGNQKVTVFGLHSLALGWCFTHGHGQPKFEMALKLHWFPTKDDASWMILGVFEHPHISVWDM